MWFLLGIQHNWISWGTALQCHWQAGFTLWTESGGLLKYVYITNHNLITCWITWLVNVNMQLPRETWVVGEVWWTKDLSTSRRTMALTQSRAIPTRLMWVTDISDPLTCFDISKPSLEWEVQIHHSQCWCHLVRLQGHQEREWGWSPGCCGNSWTHLCGHWCFSHELSGTYNYAGMEYYDCFVWTSNVLFTCLSCFTL